MSDRKIIGYQPIYEVPRGSIVTQAFILCSRCGVSISRTGGPRFGSLCLTCVGPAEGAPPSADVPREPSIRMLEAGSVAADTGKLTHIWRAMWDAAPKSSADAEDAGKDEHRAV